MVMPHGYIKPIGHVPLHPSDDQMKLYLFNSTGSVNYAKGKTKMAAWLVSNCKTVGGRKELVKELQKYVDVGKEEFVDVTEKYYLNIIIFL